jgi:plastocyanin
MAGTPVRIAFFALLLAGSHVRAATVTIQISDTSGRPAANAVAALSPERSVGLPPPQPAAEAVVDQRKETFIPLVTVIRKGGRVVFTNNDTTMHQVYSFSPIKQFEFEIDEGRRSAPVVFDKAGVASIGCNIHDHMITYVFVADTPWAALTDSAGRAQMTSIPDGRYRVEVWHPQLVPGRPNPTSPLEVRGDTKLTLPIPLLMASSGKHMHMGSY